MIGTHADSLVAEAIVKGFKDFDRKLAYEAVLKDATVPPEGDTTRRWLDREPHVPYEARAGLSWSRRIGYIPADKVSESASSTLEETYDDYAVAIVAKALGDDKGYRAYIKRSLAYRTLFNPATGFMQARNLDGSWAAPTEGWTEGDQWVYLFAALHDIPGTIALLAITATTTSRATITAISMISAASHGRRRHRSAASRRPPMATRRPACWAMKIAARCPPGTCSRRWASIRSIRCQATI